MKGSEAQAETLDKRLIIKNFFMQTPGATIIVHVGMGWIGFNDRLLRPGLPRRRDCML
jgi:hypothetical protein